VTSGVAEGLAVPAPLVAPFVLLVINPVDNSRKMKGRWWNIPKTSPDAE